MPKAMRVTRSRISMLFRRRLAVLGAAGLVATILIGARLVHLTVVEGAALRASAERAIRREKLLPTWRGRILDRNNVPLAEDRASWTLALPFAVIDGTWAQDQALRAARETMGTGRWSSASPEQRAHAQLDALREFDEMVNALLDGIAELTSIERLELDRRLGSIRHSISRMVASVQNAQRLRFETQRADRPGEIRGEFRLRPIAEQLESHDVIGAIDDDTAFALRALATELEQRTRKATGGNTTIEPLIELLDGSRRDRPSATAIVRIDRTHFPKPLREATPIELLVTGIGDHIVGTVRERVVAEDLYRRPFRDSATGEIIDLGGYRSGTDMVGARGIEAAMETQLRGALGIEQTNLETSKKTVAPAQPGLDVTLTIDIVLQAHVQALLDPRVGLASVQQYHLGWLGDGSVVQLPRPAGTPLDGAAVVLDIETGEVLAMASSPTTTEGQAMDAGARATHAPFLHRAVEATYPPGSIVKPLVYVAAVDAGVIGVNEEIACSGHYFPHSKTSARCWIYRERYGFATHGGPLDASDAIKNSCNIYFYTVADRLGFRRIIDGYRRFGVGGRLGSGLGYERPVEVRDDNGEHTYRDRWFGESAGSLPSDDRVSKLEAAGDPSVIFLGIGQGEFTWTPLHAANAYATLVRGGVQRGPTLIKGASVVRDSEAFNPEAVRIALDGLRRVVNEQGGSGRRIRYSDGAEPIFDLPGLAVWGKTGTAQAPPLRIDVDGDGRFDGPLDQSMRGLDHAWFVGLVGDARDSKPRYAIAVILEHAGSGGRAAGPLAAEIMRALRQHGYLSAAPWNGGTS